MNTLFNVGRSFKNGLQFGQKRRSFKNGLQFGQKSQYNGVGLEHLRQYWQPMYCSKLLRCVLDDYTDCKCLPRLVCSYCKPINCRNFVRCASDDYTNCMCLPKYIDYRSPVQLFK
jgi:hypothetical protein